MVSFEVTSIEQPRTAPLAESTIPGGPGVDYPTFSAPPPTTFSCSGLVQGYYADQVTGAGRNLKAESPAAADTLVCVQETDCQVYHVCGSDASRPAPISSLLCPNGTLYNQQYFVCDWWFNVDCSVVSAAQYCTGCLHYGGLKTFLCPNPNDIHHKHVLKASLYAQLNCCLPCFT